MTHVTPQPSPVDRPVPLPTSARRGGAPRTERNPLASLVFTVIACGLVVAAASMVPMLKDRRADTLAVRPEPAAYALQATGELSRLSSLPALPAADAAPLADAQSAAGTTLQSALDEAMVALQAALADASLPALPEGYVPGGEVDVDLPRAEAYPLPTFIMPELGFPSLRLDEPALSGSPVGQGSGSAIDGLLAQFEGLQAQLQDVLGSTPVGGLPVEGLPTGLPGGLPLTGAPQQVGDADDTVEPDEQGALAASRHAEAALGATTQAYGELGSDLQELLALYEGLSARVEQAIADLREGQSEVEDGVQALLEERLAAIEEQVADLEARASGLVAQHAKAVASAEAAADKAIVSAGTAGAGSIDDAVEAQVAALEAKSQSILADAEERKAAIQAIATSAAGDLGSDPDATEALQAIQAAATAAALQVDHDATAQVADVEAQAEAVRAEAGRVQDELDARVQDALAQADTRADEALALDGDVREYLMAAAQAQGVLMQQREADLAHEALGKVGELADEAAASYVAEALKGARAAQETLERAGPVVDDVEGLLSGEVGKDLDYVAKVGEDYGRVPTEDRKARAAHWAETALGLEGVLDEALASGQGLADLADDALAAAQQAEAEISALA